MLWLVGARSFDHRTAYFFDSGMISPIVGSLFGEDIMEKKAKVLDAEAMMRKAFEQRALAGERRRQEALSQKVKNDRYEAELKFEVWAMELVWRERRVYLLLGALLGCVVTFLPWYLMGLLLDGYDLEVPLHWSHLLFTGLPGLACVHLLGFTVFRSRMRELWPQIEKKAEACGIQM